MTDPSDHRPDHSAEEPIDLRRRLLLKYAGLALGGAATAAVGAPLVGFALAPGFRSEPDQWVNVGPVDSFPEQQIRRVAAVDPLHAHSDGVTSRSPCTSRGRQATISGSSP